MRRKKASLTSNAGNWMSACQGMKLDWCLSPLTEINSKWTKDLNTNPSCIK